MKLGFNEEQENFRAQAAAWLEEQLSGPFAEIRGMADHTALADIRIEWEKAMGKAGWSAIGWPKQYGGREATLAEQVIWAEEYARAKAPGRLGHLGVELAGPTILAFGNDEQKARFLPKIAAGEEIWCQGYSEPNAGSDLSNVKTRARLEDGPNGKQWVLEGQKTWTSLAQFADWSFVVCRTEEGSTGRDGISYLLVPMNQQGITVRPIKQMTGESEFNEVFFDGAVTAAENVVGVPGQGWKVAMGTLSFERGVSTLAQQMNFHNELQELIEVANANGAARDPQIRRRIAEAWSGLRIMRASALRMLSGADSGSLSNAAFTYKIYWATWHKKVGELVMDVLGPVGELAKNENYEFQNLTKTFLYSRADTIYAGTNQIQRNVISERALGLPKEPRG